MAIKSNYNIAAEKILLSVAPRANNSGEGEYLTIY